MKAFIAKPADHHNRRLSRKCLKEAITALSTCVMLIVLLTFAASHPSSKHTSDHCLFLFSHLIFMTSLSKLSPFAIPPPNTSH
jgi:hypothetical protein